MHVLAVAFLLLQALFSAYAWHERDEKGEDSYRAALGADTDAARQFQLAQFGVFKTQVATHRLRTELYLVAAIIVLLLFGHEIGAEVHSVLPWITTG